MTDARSRPRFWVTRDGVDEEISAQVRACRLNKSGTLDRDSLRIRPGAAGRITLSNLDHRWTPGRSTRYDATYLANPIPLRVMLGERVWFRGELLLGAGDPKAATVSGQISSALSDAYGQGELRAHAPEGTQLEAAMEAVASALGVDVGFTGSQAEQELAVGAFDQTRRAGDWLLAMCEALPSAVWEADDGSLQVRTLSDLRRDPRSNQLFSDQRHYVLDDVDSGPDSRRVVNRYEIANRAGEVAAYEDTASQAIWRVRTLTSRWDLWGAVPAREFWEDGLDEHASPPQVTRVGFPLVQPSAAALAEVLAIEAGVRVRLRAADVNLQRLLVVGLSLVTAYGRIPELRITGLTTTFEPLHFVPGTYGLAGASYLGSHAVLSPRGWRGVYWVLGRARLGRETVLGVHREPFRFPQWDHVHWQGRYWVVGRARLGRETILGRR